MNKKIIYLGGPLLIFFAVAAIYVSFKTSAQSKIISHTAEIGGVMVHVAIADTPALREQGLSGTKPLAPDQGMLFIFESDGIYSFWMKDMNYSLDIVWLDSGGKIVFIENNLSPNTFPNAYASNVPARYVLELPANFVKTHNVALGDIVRL